ncbi:TetR family transcriptional regulator C-terminal domain-containing protein [Streptomyces sp. FXJ1.4098]|nr:TetR family transcriptional regulator C-terminal domain-containing protein [Streptomyces sp. FXJ1.4098]
MVGKAFAGAAGEGQTMVDGMVASTRHATDHPGLAKLYVTLSAAATDPESPAHSYFTERYRSLAAEITEYVQEQQENGVVRADLPADHLAGTLLAVLDGLQVQWMHEPTVDIAAIAETFTRMLLPSVDSVPEAGQAD